MSIAYILLVAQAFCVYFLYSSKRHKVHVLEIEVSALRNQLLEVHQMLYQAKRKKFAHVYRLAAVGKVAVGLLHDIANPLTFSMLFLERKHQRSLGQVRSALQQAGALIEHTRCQLRCTDIRERFSIATEIKHAVAFLHHKLVKQNVLCILDVSSTLTLQGDKYKFYQCISNILSNAIDAYEHCSPEKKRLIEVSAVMKDDRLSIHVEDHACGIAEKFRPYIFMPFFTTKSHDSGMGIGLAETKDIVEKYFYGKICFQTQCGKGTTFTLNLPCHPPLSRVNLMHDRHCREPDTRKPRTALRRSFHATSADFA